PGLSQVVGEGGYDPARVAIVGLRSVDKGERTALRELGVSLHTMREVDEQGLCATMAKALGVVAPDGGEFALSLDLDALDPREAPGVGTPVPGGFTFREAHLAMEMVADHGGLVGVDVVEVNPSLDDRNRTARLAVGLVASALGRKII
ncbi:arginase family protein, partial [bacterium]|nr:arginase family protein [bacterium]